jgi:hypothetical protein
MNAVLMSKYNEYQKYLTQQGRILPKKIPAKPYQQQQPPPKQPVVEDQKIAPLKIRLSARKKRRNEDSDDQRMHSSIDFNSLILFPYILQIATRSLNIC